ncbi:MAG: NAD(P)H-dependent oxidoreductase [Vicinamibacterales bacterium]
MSKRVVIIDGHPDASGTHFGHALAAAYAQAAEAAGHEVRSIPVGALDFPMLRHKADWEHGAVPVSIQEAQRAIGWAEHLVIVYPLWLGSMPACLKAFMEQVFRPGFAIGRSGGIGRWKKRLTGKSARVIVTMGMPALVYRWYFRAHSLKSLERNVLQFCGIGPIRDTVIGMVETPNPRKRERWLERMRLLGREAQ